ncbi:MAG: molecular chaperone DnaJ [Anaerolineae bacterium]|nr:molecular chaperone DnaJ [Anaerolineae bacterium]
MSQKQDYYQLLGVERSANPDEIRRAYRKLAREYHPDVSEHPDAESRFKEINEAYQVLSNAEKRALYDRFGHAGPGNAGFGFDFGFRDPFDIFEQVFGGQGGFGFRSSRRSGPRRGADLRYDLGITFDEAVFGCKKEIEVVRRESCPECKGSGAEPGTTPLRCSECNGQGQVRRVQHSLLGSFVNVTPCPKCQGSGEVISIPCRHCEGTGKVHTKRRLTVNIPAGVDHGTQIRLAGEGEAGERGGPPGNLYVVLEVEPHPHFRRRNNDLLLELGINVAQAALGTEVTIPTLEGQDTFEIPAGTQTGKVFRLRGRGVPQLRGSGRGDLLILTRVETPTKLSREQKELFRQLAATLNGETITEVKEPTFLDRLRDVFGL